MRGTCERRGDAVPTTYATPVGLAAQVVIDAFAAGYTDQGISDISGEAAHALARPDTSSSIVVIGEPVVAVVLSGPLDFAPTARDFLGRFTSPDVLAFWDAIPAPPQWRHGGRGQDLRGHQDQDRTHTPPEPGRLRTPISRP